MQQLAAPRYRAESVAETIKAQGRSVTWLARQLGVSRQYTSDVVHGRRTVRRDFAERVAALLGMPFFMAFDVSDGAVKAPREEAA